MASYSFSSREIAETLADVGRKAMAGSALPQEPTGRETIFVKTPANGIAARAGDVCTAEDCTRVYISDLELSENTSLTVPVVNTTEELVEGDIYISATRVGVYWVFDGGGGGRAKRVKFVLTQALCKTGSLQSGFALAEVIDPMTSGQTIDDQITVWDYKQQFVLADAGAIGVAAYGNPYGAGLQWHIEWCEQPVIKVKGVLADSLAPWTGVPAVTISEAKSSWPYVDWQGSETIGSTLGTVQNPERFTANVGWVECERLIPSSHLPVPTNTVAPYTLAPLSTEWNITSCENMTARWCSTLFTGGNFLLTGDQYAEGNADPLQHSEFSAGDIANPPAYLWDEFADLACHIKADTRGWAFLDDKLGKFMTVMTGSALFGLPEVVEAVAKFDEDTEPLIKAKSGDCGVIEHKHLQEMLVWGNPSGPSGTGGCEMTQATPAPEVDVFEHASDITVVTGTTTNADGEIELTTVEIKACDTPSANLSLPYSTQDVITDISCVGDSLEKSYKELKFIGNATGGNSNVGLPCTDPINYDWETIFNNYIWNQSWYSISYYDINFPEGCFPCPTGCCTQTLYDGSTNQVYPLTDSDCTATVNSSPSNPTDVVSVSWSAGECDDPPAGGCNGTYVSGFSIGGFGGVSGCSATFTQTGTALISGGTATINGNWSGVAGSMPQGSVAGTFTFTTDGTNHSASGALPSVWGGGTVSVSNTGTCTGTYQGSASLSGGNSPCGGMINGTHDFTLT
jgi:hypothetical protein